MTTVELVNLELERLHKLLDRTADLETDARVFDLIQGLHRTLTTTTIWVKDDK